MDTKFLPQAICYHKQEHINSTLSPSVQGKGSFHSFILARFHQSDHKSGSVSVSNASHIMLIILVIVVY